MLLQCGNQIVSNYMVVEQGVLSQDCWYVRTGWEYKKCCVVTACVICVIAYREEWVTVWITRLLTQLQRLIIVLHGLIIIG